MQPRRRYLFVLALSLVAGLAIGGGARADGPHRAGLVIDYGNGQVVTACIAFNEPSITGMDMLLRAERSLVTGFGGGTVCQVDGVGCSDGNNCWCECPGTPCRYWIYYYLSGGQWKYSGLGATARQVHDGDVEGWVWGEGQLNAGGAMPPLFTFDQLCAPPPTQPPTDTPPPPTTTPTLLPTDTPIVLGSGPTATEPPSIAPTATSRPSTTPVPQLPTASPVPPSPTTPSRPTSVVPTTAPTWTPRPVAQVAPTVTAVSAGPSPTASPASNFTPVPPTNTAVSPTDTPRASAGTPAPTLTTTRVESISPSPTATFVRIQLPATPEPPVQAQPAGQPLGYATFAAIVVGLVALLLTSGRRTR
jgi:hypothetical protein